MIHTRRLTVSACLALGLLALGTGAASAKCYADATGSGQTCENIPAGGNNTDGSSASPSLSGLNLLATLAAAPGRRGYVVEAQDTSANCATNGGANGLIVALDDGASGTVTVLTLAYATAKGGQGGNLDMSGMPHSGRIRIYGTASCQVGAAQW